MKTFFKAFLLAVVMTMAFHPKPFCLAAQRFVCMPKPFILLISGLSSLFEAPSSDLLAELSFDLMIALSISLLTALCFVFFKKRRVFKDKIESGRFRSSLLFLVAWITLMIIFTAPYYVNAYSGGFPPAMFRYYFGGYI